MKKLKLIKVIASSLIIASMLSLNPIGASAAWKKDSTGWWNTEGNSYSIGWRQLDGQWYYFNSDGYVAKGWKEIDGTWYYFDESGNYYISGEMQHDTIIDGYYLNSNGSWYNATTEIQAYINLLNDTNWQKNNGIIFSGSKSTIDENTVIDINQDGVYEMLVHHGSCEANLTTSVITYNNGNIKIEHLSNDHGRYMGYSKSQKVFFICGGTQGFGYIKGYKLENNHCVQVYSSTSNAGAVGEENATYTVNGQTVSEAECKKSMEAFGEIN